MILDALGKISKTGDHLQSNSYLMFLTLKTKKKWTHNSSVWLYGALPLNHCFKQKIPLIEQSYYQQPSLFSQCQPPHQTLELKIFQQIISNSFLYFFICISQSLSLYLYLCISVSLYLYLYVYTCVSIYIYLYLFVCICLYASVCLYLFVCICLSASVCLHLFVCICLSVYVYLYLKNLYLISNYLGARIFIDLKGG